MRRDGEAARKMLRKYASKEKAQVLQRFFKTGPGEYGEGDKFIGVTVPNTRKVARANKCLGRKDIKILLSSDIHEERLLALLILVQQYEGAGSEEKKRIYAFYLKNTKHINNWDLVDLSAPKIVGDFLLNRSRNPLYKLARSKDLWERRIAILSTFSFIRADDHKDAIKISEILLCDEHDLIHKAVGWMLREVGKRDIKAEEGFLEKNYRKMPRTMLRYAIERFPEKRRKFWLNRK